MKVILKTKDGFEKMEERKDFHPVIEHVVHTTLDGSILTHNNPLSAVNVRERQKTFIFDKEERIFYYKEI